MAAECPSRSLVHRHLDKSAASADLPGRALLPLRALRDAHAAASWPARSGLRHPPDEGSGPNGMWNLGNLIHDFEKMRKIVGGRIGADFD